MNVVYATKHTIDTGGSTGGIILGLADVPWSHLTREFLVIDALIGRRGGAYAEMGLAEVFT